MLIFFRKVRRQFLAENFGKYLLYAVGEIVLVVIGILIAVGIKNWNDGQNEQEKLKEYAVSLIQDLEKDYSQVDVIRLQNLEIISRIDSLGNYVREKSIEDINNLDVFYYTINKPHRPYIWSRATIDELKSSGSIGRIENKELSALISAYDALTHHLDEDYINDRAQFELATELANSIVNNNYPNYYEFVSRLLPNDDIDSAPGFFESQEYLSAKAYRLSLVTDDIKEVYKTVNNYNVLKSYLRIRTDVELPELMDDIEKLIALLNETYVE